MKKTFTVGRYFELKTFWILKIKNLVQSAIWKKWISGSSNRMEEQAGRGLAPRDPGEFFSMSN